MMYLRIMSERDSFRETNDCAVIASSVVTGRSYSETWATFAKYGRARGKGTARDVTFRSLFALGYRVMEVTHHFKSKTVKSIGRELKKRDIRHPLLVAVRGHILAATDATIHDWTAGRQHRITQVYIVYPWDESAPSLDMPAAPKTIKRAGTDRFGAKHGTNRAKIHAVLTTVHRCAQDIANQSGVDIGYVKAHLNYMSRLGKVDRRYGQFYALKCETH